MMVVSYVWPNCQEMGTKLIGWESRVLELLTLFLNGYAGGLGLGSECFFECFLVESLVNFGCSVLRPSRLAKVLNMGSGFLYSHPHSSINLDPRLHWNTSLVLSNFYIFSLSSLCLLLVTLSQAKTHSLFQIVRELALWLCFSSKWPKKVTQCVRNRFPFCECICNLHFVLFSSILLIQNCFLIP